MSHLRMTRETVAAAESARRAASRVTTMMGRYIDGGRLDDQMADVVMAAREAEHRAQSAEEATRALADYTTEGGETPPRAS